MTTKSAIDIAREDIAKAVWNKCADQHNQWSVLGSDEKEELIAKVSAALSASQPVVDERGTEYFTPSELGPIDANKLEQIAKERPNERFLKGSGVLKLLRGIRQLEGELRAALSSQPVINQQAQLPFAILSDEMKALHRFHECVTDGEGYDVSKEMMRRLSEIGLVRRVTANYYEHTTFGLSVINGDFAAPVARAESKDAERYQHLVEEAISVGKNGAIDPDEVVLVVPADWGDDWRERTGKYIDAAIAASAQSDGRDGV